MGTIFILIIQMKNLRLRKVKLLVLSYTASKTQLEFKARTDFNTYIFSTSQKQSHYLYWLKSESVLQSLLRLFIGQENLVILKGLGIIARFESLLCSLLTMGKLPYLSAP